MHAPESERQQDFGASARAAATTADSITSQHEPDFSGFDNDMSMFDPTLMAEFHAASLDNELWDGFGQL